MLERFVNLGGSRERKVSQPRRVLQAKDVYYDACEGFTGHYSPKSGLGGLEER